VRAHETGFVPRGTIGAAGDLAVWALGYSVGLYLLTTSFVRTDWCGACALYVGLCAHAGYLFDRVKLRDRELDPADLAAYPARHLFLRRHARVIRVVMVLEWVGAVVVGAWLHWVLGVLVLGGVVAGVVYSGGPAGTGRKRVKDWRGVKAAAVATAIVGLALHAALLPGGVWESVDWVRVAWVGAGAWFVVCGDAVLCDLDDVEADRRFGTGSVPVLVGGRVAGMMGVGLVVVGVLVLVGMGGARLGVRVGVGAALVVSAVMALGMEQKRDWIDGRMGVVVLVAMLVA
jgi:4-hydroxybenzoate polyprenyltransferase